MKHEIRLTPTEDGSHTLYLPEIDESYHSVHGAIQESMHIFIEAGLKLCERKEIRILEIGFGTGLNAYLSALFSEGKKIHYTSVEKYPLPEGVSSQLNYASEIGESNDLFLSLHQCEWDKVCEINSNFSLLKKHGDICEIELDEYYDVIFFDAFSPEKQAELWTETIFSKIYKNASDGAILTTYCAKGRVRRTLQQVGFEVERIPGPPGKREILRARKK